MTGSWRAWLPAEHGVWGLLAGAALVGLPLGGDLAGLPLLIAAVLMVLLQARYGHPRWLLALPLAASPAVLTWLVAPSGWLPWAVAAAGCGWLHHLAPRRSWAASGLAGAAFAGLAAAIAAAGGAPTAWAAVAAGVLAAHAVGMVPLVRAQTRPDPRWPVLAIEAHVVAAIIAIGTWAADLVSFGIPALFLLGLARCLCILHKQSMLTPARIGARELGWLPVVASAVVLSVRL